MNYLEVIRGPLITEKLDKAQESHNQYAFLVDRKANKHDIRSAVERLFKVSVEAVHTSIVRGKTKRIGRSIGQRPNFKKALVTLKKGESIALFKQGAA
jgi:large subunit ribosomal protein L23